MKTLVIQKDKSQLQAELERVNKELLELRGKAVSCTAVANSFVCKFFGDTVAVGVMY